VGTLPVNLSNFEGFDIGADMLGLARKRDTWLSYGTDVLLVNAAGSSSLKRLTNSTGGKIIVSPMD
jgi:hypothetical protein